MENPWKTNTSQLTINNLILILCKILNFVIHSQINLIHFSRLINNNERNALVQGLIPLKQFSSGPKSITDRFDVKKYYHVLLPTQSQT